MLRRILFKFYVYFIGFKFDITSIDNGDVIYNSMTVVFQSGAPMVFNFFKGESWFNVYRWNKIKRMPYPRFGVSMNFEDQNHPEIVQNYNNKLMVFYVPYSFLLSEVSITKYLLDVYMDYLLNNVKTVNPEIIENPVPDTGLRRRYSDIAHRRANEERNK